MDGTEGRAEPGAGPPRSKFSADLAGPGDKAERYAGLRRRWDRQIGDKVPLPPAEMANNGDFRVSVRGSKVHDALIANLRYDPTGTERAWVDSHYFPDMLVMDVVRRGTWHYTRSRGRDQVSVSPGQFIVRYNNPSWRFAVGPHTTKKLILPVAHLGPLIRKRPVFGSADSAEMQLLLAHARMVEAVLDDLSPAGLQTARDTLVELVVGVLAQKIDETEPLLAASLAQAAKNLVDRHLADRDLSPTMLARELKVSVRTLNRAFASIDDSITAYIRQKRLEQARLALTTPVPRLSVSELAAHFQFADSSHFIRAFKKQYGQTPNRYARSHGPGAAAEGP
ncbi:AraC family transcriptional activator of tynA and feaB [Streptomyces aurantiacus]|uniref:helix-turn-helix domain-containing protein n=1 Tax=Streptomyces aurantiacus TaxID=47760 RepID=UPI002792378F|nr:helix-turn-helix domain-containing protein [Streptomyces aurantiacus]MDQ0779633.1 AraC family transcriptional activator of tynA and feaB [Streptomyces aurantiacus]